MKYRGFGERWIVRIDKGEEIVEELKRFCREKGIRAGSLTGIGATDHARIGSFKGSTREYLATEVKGDHEITNLTGNIAVLDGEVYLHLHVTLSDGDCRAFGGHLNAAVVSGTCEVAVEVFSGEMEREFDPGVGLNLYKL